MTNTKRVLIEYPIVGWASTPVDVPEDWDWDRICEAIDSDELEVAFSLDNIEALNPYLSINDAIEEARSASSELLLHYEVRE